MGFGIIPLFVFHVTEVAAAAGSATAATPPAAAATAGAAAAGSSSELASSSALYGVYGFLFTAVHTDVQSAYRTSYLHSGLSCRDCIPTYLDVYILALIVDPSLAAFDHDS